MHHFGTEQKKNTLMGQLLCPKVLFVRLMTGEAPLLLL